MLRVSEGFGWSEGLGRARSVLQDAAGDPLSQRGCGDSVLARGALCFGREERAPRWWGWLRRDDVAQVARSSSQA